MATNLKQLPVQIQDHIPDGVKEFPWTRAVAAGSLVAGAILLFSGRRKAALAVAVAGTTIAAFDDPEAMKDFKEFLENAPKHLRTGQDFLVRAENVLEDLKAKGEKLKGMLSRA